MDNVTDQLLVQEQIARVEEVYAIVKSWATVRGAQGPEVPLDLIILDDRPEPVSSCYVPEERSMYIGLHAYPDDLAHEVGHSFVDLLKPGFRLGAVRVMHEAIADMAAVLCAYRDADCLEGVIEETGGDFGLESEATRIDSGASVRSACLRTTLDDIGFSRYRVTMSELEIPGSLCDPHYVSGVLTGALHDLFRALVNEGFSRGKPRELAVEEATDTVGTLMFRALYFVGEHRVSLRDYAAALLRADSLFFGGRSEAFLEPILLQRGLLASLEEDGDVPPVTFRLDPTEQDGGRVIESVWVLETRLLSCVGLPLVFHRPAYPYPVFVDSETVELYADWIAPEGYRQVRLRYLCPLDSVTQRSYESMFGGSERAVEMTEIQQVAFASFLFDPQGELVCYHTDRPMPEILHGFL
jgi:hypothetical protein